ncbi:sugar ABC transporter permease [Actinoallomurus purpureus]|uniref:carbohydrate ABC transporter permease n=1 Tax=Actinoallomurus purpureus TaxID=478114 RepID=UPI002093CF70|nr:sugar ABC transporter permease [Actinoallomurus purpureus]MCO6008069.1 sugar ABC transporter permease [Actinoallomurus purpureus]
MVSITSSRLVRGREARRAAPALERPGVAWAIPGLVFFILFAIVPMAGVVYLSLTRWDGLSTPQFTGLHNWWRFFSDGQILQSTLVTAVLLVGNILVQAPISILLGVWSAGYQRNRAVLSTIFFFPLLLSTAATAVMWRQLLDPNFGIPPKLADLLGGNTDLLGGQKGAIACLIVVTSWQFIPFHTLIYQGAARAIPLTLYQAAAIDGAGRVRQFFHITLPQLRNSIITSTTFMVVGGLTAFDIVLLLTNGGPGTDTSILPFAMYQTAFRTYDYGYASVIASFLLLLATGASLLLVKISGYDKMTSTMEGL